MKNSEVNSKGILLQQDNARVHTCKIAMDAVAQNGYELIPYPQSNEEVVAAVEEWVRDKDPGFFSFGLMALEHCWSKCIILEGNYIKKEEIDLTQK